MKPQRAAAVIRLVKDSDAGSANVNGGTGRFSLISLKLTGATTVDLTGAICMADFTNEVAAATLYP